MHCRVVVVGFQHEVSGASMILAQGDPNVVGQHFTRGSNSLYSTLNESQANLYKDMRLTHAQVFVAKQKAHSGGMLGE